MAGRVVANLKLASGEMSAIKGARESRRHEKSPSVLFRLWREIRRPIWRDSGARRALIYATDQTRAQ